MKTGYIIGISVASLAAVMIAASVIIKKKNTGLISGDPEPKPDAVPISQDMIAGGVLNERNLMKVVSGEIYPKPEIDVLASISKKQNAPIGKNIKDKYFGLLLDAGYIDINTYNGLIA